MRDKVETTIRAWALWAPRKGWVLGTTQVTREAAALRLADRVANGDAFTGERVRRLKARMTVDLVDGSVAGYLVPIIYAG